MDNRKASSFSFQLAAFCFAVIGAFGATYRISAPGGVGDVTALTNIVAQLNAGNHTGTKILLEPGVYDLHGTATIIGGNPSNAHLYFNTKCIDGLFAGLGDKPGDTILLGGGATDGKKIIHAWTGEEARPFVISNLTITGGYTSGDGGGIQGSSALVLKYVVISNNYAKGSNGAGGGGVLRARAYNCLFADNTCGSQHGGGLWTDSSVQGAWDCIFTNNAIATSGKYGGGLYMSKGGECVGCQFLGNAGKHASGAYMASNGLVSNCVFRGNAATGAASSDKVGGGLYLASGTCIDCVFENNAADRGGGMYVGSASSIVRNCLFERNRQTGWASGAALFVNASSPLALVSNCVFNANVANKESSRTIISNADLVDCVITNHDVLSGYVIAGCNMTRCLFAHNSTTVNAQHLDIGTIYGGTTVYRTNVNCIVAYNHAIGASSMTDGKKVVNCTYYGNLCDIGNNANSGILHDCVAWNSIIAGNTITGIGAMDVRRPYLTNCVFTASALAVNADGLSGCKQSSNIKFEPSATGGEFDIRHSSPARDLGVIEEWMVPLLGATDYAGRPRVMFSTIDAGALECQRPPQFFQLRVQ